MCSLFMPIRMENYQGDLTDILRAGSASTSGGVPYHNIDHHHHHQEAHTAAAAVDDSWHFPSATPMDEEEAKDDFGDPFSSFMRDPLLHELDLSSSSYFHSPNNSSGMSITVDESVTTTAFGGGGGLGIGHGCVEGGDPLIKRPCDNIFSRMLQISPSGKVPAATCDSPMMVGGAVLSSSSPRGMMKVGGDMVINVNSSSSAAGKGCLLENTGVMQISSPRNPGIKRRKSQAKKVVCIPAPAAVNSRPTGEVVPSDLWAWRKYGQKPIKGSPYPRGYYRCSSSKGCSARKQVERSRTDPNMLVITYTSEHNHPWPTQRNALAGSTRSQPSKAGAGPKTSPNNFSHHQKQTSPMMLKEEQNETMNDNNASPIGTSGSTVKEEFEEIEKHLELENHHSHQNHHQGFGYRPSMPDQGRDQQQSSHQEDSFFADLGEIEADPLNLLFSQCFTADEQQKGPGGNNKAAANADAADGPLDPFNLLDWSADHNTNSNTTSFGEAKRRL